jgi:hypothetical protein
MSDETTGWQRFATGKHWDGDEEKAQYCAKYPLYKLAPRKSSEIEKRKQDAHHALDVRFGLETPVFDGDGITIALKCPTMLDTLGHVAAQNACR